MSYVCIGRLRVRVISVYMPTSDYGIADIEEVYGHLGILVTAAHSKRMKMILGRDFNTKYGIGSRGELLNDFVEGHKLHLGNYPGLNPENEWTFEHALGHK